MYVWRTLSAFTLFQFGLHVCRSLLVDLCLRWVKRQTLHGVDHKIGLKCHSTWHHTICCPVGNSVCKVVRQRRKHHRYQAEKHVWQQATNKRVFITYHPTLVGMAHEKAGNILGSILFSSSGKNLSPKLGNWTRPHNGAQIQACECWGCLHILSVSVWNRDSCQAVANSVTLPLSAKQWPECNDRWHIGCVDAAQDRTQTPSVTRPY